MANSPTFLAHAVELLERAGPVLPRSMFGGHGLYHRGAMFALVDDDELYLKSDPETRPRFEAEGCVEWVYRGAPAGMKTGYFRPPDAAHEDPEEMLPWARLAIEAALRLQARKAAKEKAKGKGRAKGKAKGKAKAATSAKPRPRATRRAR